MRIENVNNVNCTPTESFSIEIFDIESNPVDDIEICAVTGNTGINNF